MLSKKLKWYPLFESLNDLEELLSVSNKTVYRSMFGEVLLVKIQDRYHAFKNKCPHQNKPLNDCSIQANKIVCPYHRYGFSTENGRGHGLCLEKYELKVEKGQVWLGKEVWSLF